MKNATIQREEAPQPRTERSTQKMMVQIQSPAPRRAHTQNQRFIQLAEKVSVQTLEILVFEYAEILSQSFHVSNFEGDIWAKFLFFNAVKYSDTYETAPTDGSNPDARTKRLDDDDEKRLTSC